MEWLNYHHLYYFWTVVREGGIAAASRALAVGRPSISMQLKSLEGFIGGKLFVRRGRYLDLTETGRMVFDYAEDIFALGRELVDASRNRATGRPRKLRVGVADVMAKIVAFKLLLPALESDEGVAIECREDDPEALFAQLAVQKLDLVLSDIPLAPRLGVRAFNHVLGESTMTLFGTTDLVGPRRGDFPASLNGAPFLMPSECSAIRRSLEHWFSTAGVRPVVVGEFEDSALMKVFGQAGRGIFPAPTVIAADVKRKYKVQALAEVGEVRERFYAITGERRVAHPAVLAITAAARRDLFGPVERT